MNTKQIVLASRPTGTPQLTDFRFELTELPELNPGDVFLKPLFFSVDPYLRGRMKDAKSYINPFQIDQPIESNALATVIKSKSDKFEPGDLIMRMLPWREMTIVSDKDLQKIDATSEHISYYLSVLGMTGLTAYFGLMHICKPLAGETVVISAAAGAVGLVVGQIARIHGCRVVGIAGSDEKVRLLVEGFDFDQAINYKTAPDLSDAIAAACPEGVDVYFDNVGGEISDAVLSNLNFKARIAICGQISLYNSTTIPVGPRLQPIILSKSALMKGFLINNYKSEFPEGMKYLTKWVKEGKLKFTETVFHGFAQLPTAFLGLFNGENTGKMIVKV
ncbi:MAG: NADP-dependent oxidoreductase [Bacteroidota bacterium]|nr:NADP-dependent oxidoreductase [Bacteroidota bacterium]